MGDMHSMNSRLHKSYDGTVVGTTTRNNDILSESYYLEMTRLEKRRLGEDEMCYSLVA